MEIPDLSEKLEEYLDSKNTHRAPHKVENIAEINMGWETELYTFESHFAENCTEMKEDLVVRIFSGENSIKKASKEFYLMNKLDNIGYPVPPVYHLETCSDVIGKPFIIMKRIMGKTLDESYRNETPEQLKAGMLRLMELFAKLHRIDASEFKDSEYLISEDSIQYYIDYFKESRDEHAPWMSPVIDWLTENTPNDTAEYQSVIHLDYHGMNVMVDEQDNCFVIDWGSSKVGDSRLDLGWTLLLYNTFGGSMFHTPLIEAYENYGGKTQGLRFFEVMAAARRIMDCVNVLDDKSAGGLRPDVVELMKREKAHFLKVHDFLEDRTGIRLAEFDKILSGF